MMLILSTNALSANTSLKNEREGLTSNVDSDLSTEHTSVSCDEVLKSCDKALESSRDQVEVLQGLNKIRREEIERLRHNDDTWVRSRALWLGLGIVAGLAGGVYLAK